MRKVLKPNAKMATQVLLSVDSPLDTCVVICAGLLCAECDDGWFASKLVCLLFWHMQEPRAVHVTIAHACYYSPCAGCAELQVMP